jgi:Tfp pilus assembly protein PilO
MQILLVVVVATLLGLLLGWWSRGLMADMQPEDGYTSDEDIDPFGARSRLEQCHRDNAELRRDMKELEEQLEQMERVESLGREESDLVEQLKAAELRAEALLEDIQARDDTIAILESELEKLRST